MSLPAGPACPDRPLGAYPLIAHACLPDSVQAAPFMHITLPSGCRTPTVTVCGLPGRVRRPLRAPMAGISCTRLRETSRKTGEFLRNFPGLLSMSYSTFSTYYSALFINFEPNTFGLTTPKKYKKACSLLISGMQGGVETLLSPSASKKDQ